MGDRSYVMSLSLNSFFDASSHHHHHSARMCKCSKLAPSSDVPNSGAKFKWAPLPSKYLRAKKMLLAAHNTAWGPIASMKVWLPSRVRIAIAPATLVGSDFDDTRS